MRLPRPCENRFLNDGGAPAKCWATGRADRGRMGVITDASNFNTNFLAIENMVNSDGSTANRLARLRKLRTGCEEIRGGRGLDRERAVDHRTARPVQPVRDQGPGQTGRLGLRETGFQQGTMGRKS